MVKLNNEQFLMVSLLFFSGIVFVGGLLGKETALIIGLSMIVGSLYGYGLGVNRDCQITVSKEKS